MQSILWNSCSPNKEKNLSVISKEEDLIKHNILKTYDIKPSKRLYYNSVALKHIKLIRSANTIPQLRHCPPHEKIYFLPNSFKNGDSQNIKPAHCSVFVHEIPDICSHC